MALALATPAPAIDRAQPAPRHTGHAGGPVRGKESGAVVYTFPLPAPALVAVPVRGVSGDAGRPTAATYLRRRLAVLAAVISIAALAGLAIGQLLVSRGGVPASIPAAHQPSPLTYVAEPGDTLWAIAEQYRGSVSQADYVQRLVDLNGGASIDAGQAITLPGR